ncbi:MAG: MORN motif-containing protein [Cyanobacteria bacterium SBC]|nr:MORN motif-containing protein [Cyanobacteria bacterium SBC]
MKKKLSLTLLAALGLEVAGATIASSPLLAQDTIPICEPLEVYQTGSGFVQCNYDDGSNYIGTFEDFQPNGRGIYMMADGSRYEGEFRNGKPHGRGRLILDSDARYEGEFLDGVLQSGTGFFADGSRYEGGFTEVYRVETQEQEVTREEETEEGDTIEYQDTEEIEEDREASFQPHGRGTFTFANGNRYEGEFFVGQPFGGGTFYHATGTVCQGYFYNLNFDGSNCTCRYPNGASYRGELRQARPHGTGTMTLPDGTTISGAFRAGQPVSFSGYQP